MSALDYAVERVRVARANVAAEESVIRASRKALDEALAPNLEMLSEYKATLEDAELQLRALVVAHFKATGDKHPHPAVGIRKPAKPTTICTYPDGDALKYCLEHTVALSVDKGIFETFMLAMPEAMRPSWFSVREEPVEPTATIAKEITAVDAVGVVSGTDSNKLPDF